MPRPAQQAKGGSRVRRPTAKACRDRQMLFEREAAARRDPGSRRQRPSRPQHQVRIACRRDGGERPCDRHPQLAAARLQAQAIADLREYREAVEQMIAVGPPAENVQKEIYLGTGELDVGRAAACAVTSCSLASSFAASAGCGFSVSARRH